VPESRQELLLEVGCEEIPAPWLPDLTHQLAKRFTELSEKERLEAAGVQAFSTPRRLVLRADVIARQADREEKVWGPSLKVARDAKGAWTGAAQGFARKSGVAPDEPACQVPVDGFQISALLFTPSSWLSTRLPPVASTVPFGSTVPETQKRCDDIAPVGVTTGGNAHRLDEYIDLAPIGGGLAALEALAEELAAG